MSNSDAGGRGYRVVHLPLASPGTSLAVLASSPVRDGCHHKFEGNTLTGVQFYCIDLLLKKRSARADGRRRRRGRLCGRRAAGGAPAARVVDTLVTHPNVLNGALMYWPL
jgi:hypothetical protein